MATEEERATQRPTGGRRVWDLPSALKGQKLKPNRSKNRENMVSGHHTKAS